MRYSPARPCARRTPCSSPDSLLCAEPSSCWSSSPLAACAERPFLEGLLYWKLSTIPEDREIEPSVAILGAEPPDPAVEALQTFGGGR